MKPFRSLVSLTLAVLALAGFASCVEIESVVDESTTLSVEVANLAVSSDATSATFAVKSNANWKVSGDAAWITNFTQSGSGDGTITVSFPANTSETQERAAAFAVTAGKKAVAITLAQARKGAQVSAAALNASKLNLEVDAEVTEVSFDIQSNTVWGVYSESDWLENYTLYGEGNGKIVVKMGINKSRKKLRSAQFVVSAREATINLSLTQKQTTIFYIDDVTVDQFKKKEVDEDMLYRLQGQIAEYVDSLSGIIKVKDASGIVLVKNLRNSYEGAKSSFHTLAANVGDYIKLVGIRASDGNTPVLEDCYAEIVKPLINTHLRDYASLPDGDAKWIQLRGIVTSISDIEKGTLVLKNPSGNETLNVSEVLDGIGGKSGAFANLNVSVNDMLTVITPKKDGSKIETAYFVLTQPGKHGAVDLAQWMFNTSMDNTAWTPGSGIVSSGDIYQALGENEVGLTTRYLPTPDKKSRLYFVGGDRGTSGITRASVGTFSNGQVAFGTIWVGDGFQFNVDNANIILEGNKICLQMVMRLTTTSVGVWMMEYFADGQWHECESESLPIKTVNVGGKDYKYNIQRTGNNVETLQTPTFVLKHDIPAGELKIRVLAAAPYSCGGAAITAPGSKTRFRAGNGKATTWGVGVEASPCVKVVD